MFKDTLELRSELVRKDELIRKHYDKLGQVPPLAILHFAIINCHFCLLPSLQIVTDYCSGKTCWPMCKEFRPALAKDR